MARQKGSRSGYGEITIRHKGHPINTSVGSLRYESSFGGSRRAGDFGIKRVPEGYNHRPDLIADLFYGTTSLWWIVCETNAIFDVFEQLNAGDSVYLPR